MDGEHLSEDIHEESTTWGQRVALRYADFLVKWPSVNIIVVLTVVTLAAILGFVKPVAQDLPNFSEPTKGFEAWGTVISNRYSALSGLPSVPGLFPRPPDGTVNKERKRRAAPLNFCQTEVKYYIGTMAMVYEPTSGASNLLTAENLKSICRLHRSIVESNPAYLSFVVKRQLGNQSVPCPTYSLPNIIAAKYLRASCDDVTENDVRQYSVLLKYCAQFYRSGQLAKCAENSNCNGITTNCSHPFERRELYNVYHYLTDSDFARNPSLLKLVINVDLMLDPSSQTVIDNVYLPIYENHLKDLSKTKEGQVKVAAFNFFDLRFNIFNSLLLREAAFISTALLLVMILLWIYSGSIFIALMTFACVIFALLLSYSLYGVVFRLSFFPFLNVTTIIFLVGIGADDAFVYIGIWIEAKRRFPYAKGASYNQCLTRWTAYTLRHALVAMFVTSFTTAGAFYATVTTKIIAIKCFSIFAATSILTNYFLMVTFFPAIVVIYEKFFVVCTHRCMPVCCPPRTDLAAVSAPEPKNEMQYNLGENAIDDGVKGEDSKTKLTRPPSGVFHRLFQMVDRFTTSIFERYLPFVVIKGRYVWIILFLGLTVGGLIAIFVKPKLNLPLTQDFQMFSSSNSLEQYTLNYKRRFAFHMSSSGFFLDCTLVFGVVARDRRSPFNPEDKEVTKLKGSLDISSIAAQKWIVDFCKALQKAPFIRSNYIPFCEEYNSILGGLQRSCGGWPGLNPPCCNMSNFPPPSDYDYCLRSYMQNVSGSGPHFLFDSSGRLRVLRFNIPLTYEYRDSYEYNKKMFDEIEAWIAPRMKRAPDGYKDGFWTMFMGFFDLQTALATGTQESLGISVAIAFLVVLFTTLNPLISFFAILSIIGVIAVTIGTLVLAGWRLNILESIVFSVAAGLSIDFTLHYGVAYQSATEKRNRIARVRYALRHIGAAVTMGAITTFIAGLVMAPATILAYVQLSYFLMLVMTVSWFYATFFFLSLCSAFGPTQGCCQVSLSHIWPSRGSKEVDNQESCVQMDMEEIKTRPSPLPIFKNKNEKPSLG